jgi:hypothetical protein
MTETFTGGSVSLREISAQAAAGQEAATTPRNARIRSSLEDMVHVASSESAFRPAKSNCTRLATALSHFLRIHFRKQENIAKGFSWIASQ